VVEEKNCIIPIIHVKKGSFAPIFEEIYRLGLNIEVKHGRLNLYNPKNTQLKWLSWSLPPMVDAYIIKLPNGMIYSVVAEHIYGDIMVDEKYNYYIYDYDVSLFLK
jgi:hypothetical protein